MRDIVVIGSDGQLGQCVKSFDPQWTFLTEDDLDLRDPENVRLFFSDEKPKVILNLAAYTAVDKAEQETDLAIAINSESAGAIAESCEHCIYISTDYVFSGESDKPYTVDQPTSPINAYGKSKLLGEKASLAANDNTFIIRTSWLYSEFGNNFVKSMLRLASEKDELNIVNDQIGSPTYAKDLAQALIQLANGIENYKPGIYHYSNTERCSWYDFAKEIFSNKGLNIKVNPIPSSEFPTPARRPAWSVLDSSKLATELNIKIPNWKEALKRCLAEL